LSEVAAGELAERAGAADLAAAVAKLSELPGPERASALAEALPRGEVIDAVVAAVPTLPNGATNSAAALREYLFATYQPGQVWQTFIAIGLVSTVLMVIYDRWVRSRQAATG
jgi:hypothetical protein